MAENVTSTELTPKQETVIQALIAGHTIQTAALAAHVAERTAQRWLKLPHFKAAYKAAQKQVFDMAMSKLALKVEKAIDRLDFHLDELTTPAAIQVRAAQILLERAENHIQTQELEKRLSELEERLPAYE